MSKIKDLVKDNEVEFVRIEFDEQCEEYWELEQAGEDFEFVEYFDSTIYGTENIIPVNTSKGRIVYKVADYEFPISFGELKGGRFKAKDKAIFFMRWIRKSLQKDQV